MNSDMVLIFGAYRIKSATNNLGASPYVCHSHRPYSSRQKTSGMSS
jgi:hypothetical protein